MWRCTHKQHALSIWRAKMSAKKAQGEAQFIPSKSVEGPVVILEDGVFQIVAWGGIFLVTARVLSGKFVIYMGEKVLVG